MEGKIFYVTKEKLNELKKEYAELVDFERNKVVGVEAPKILESDDLNPEFVSYHENMDSLRARMDELQSIIERHQLIKNPPKDQREAVGIGAKVKLAAHGKEDEFMIVGTLEADPVAGKISNESPLGKALLGKKAGEEVHIDSPTSRTYKIKKIHYEVG